MLNDEINRNNIYFPIEIKKYKECIFVLKNTKELQIIKRYK